jgi:hypothetical protein
MSKVKNTHGDKHPWTFRERDHWMRQLLADSKLTKSARIFGIGLALSLYLQKDGRSRTIHSKNLCKAVGGVSKSSATRRIAELERTGWILVERRQGRGLESTFTLLDPPIEEKVARMTPFPIEKVARVQPEKVSASETEIQRSIQRSKRETALARGGPPGGAARAARLGPKAGAEKNFEAAWQSVHAIWQRGWADDEQVDRAAFAEACRGVDPEVIVEGAQKWVRAADAPQYLPKLVKWLEGRYWEKPPPKRGKRRTRGYNGRGGGKANMFRISLEAGGYRGGEDGNFYHPDDEGGVQ